MIMHVAMQRGWRLGGLSACLFSSSLFAADITAALGWQSKYVSEGRDNYGSGLVESGVAYEQDRWFVDLWAGRSDSQPFWEVDASLGYVFSLTETLSWTPVYTRIEESVDHLRASADEFNQALSWAVAEALQISLYHTYRFGDASSFVVAELAAEWPLNPQLSLVSYLQQAFDYGYAREDFYGPNHLQLGVAAMYQLSDRWQLSLNADLSRAQQGVKDDGLGNQYWAGGSLSYQF